MVKYWNPWILSSTAINGAGLELVAMSGKELIIRGRLQSLEWE